MNFDKYLSVINKQLEFYINKNQDIPQLLKEAMNYSVVAGGKRFRPVFLLALIEALGDDFNKGINAACAIEMIHTYSLIHDDLPCMDDDDLRRGKPTNHIVFGEGMATLAGDALLTDAFSVILESNLKNEITLKIATQLAKASGSIGMIKGQVLDILSENKTISADELKKIHLHKTGDLLKFCAYSAGVITELNEECLKYLVDMAEYMGLAFQVKDDLLDVYGDTNIIGKQVGSDEENHKNTYVSLFGKDKTEALLKEYTDKALENMNKINFKNEKEIEYLINYLTSRNK